jgi:hypothetical protein
MLSRTDTEHRFFLPINEGVRAERREENPLSQRWLMLMLITFATLSFIVDGSVRFNHL